jgi:hypothetical protein
MISKIGILLAIPLVCGLACTVWAKPPEITDLDEAMADPDFSIQGEYLGAGRLPDGSEGKVGAQVIAQGEGKFRVAVYKGGLPGDGWKRGDQRYFLDGQREADATQLKGNELVGKIADKKLTLSDADGKNKAELARVERKSPTLGAKPPQNAVVLFDGANADQFDHGTLSTQGAVFSGITSKPKFDGTYRLHLELCLSWMPAARGQGRSNSGVYLHDCYENQVLDSFGLEGANNECGGFYAIREPDVNMCFPPLEWQTYDVDFTAPKYEGDKKVANARVTLRHNGVVIHDALELERATPGRAPEGPGPRPLHLQGHGNRVQYRNIWVEPK